jgi:hypothetical protein
MVFLDFGKLTKGGSLMNQNLDILRVMTVSKIAA